jgi:hypothetical protein
VNLRLDWREGQRRRSVGTYNVPGLSCMSIGGAPIFKLGLWRKSDQQMCWVIKI